MYDPRIQGVLSKLIDYDHPSEFLSFYWIPEEISEEVSANWEEITIIGRSAPIHSYAGTGPRTISVELQFVADGTGDSVEAEVHTKVQFLKSFTYPEYIANNLKAPHRLQLIIGGFLNVVGIIESADVTWRAPFEVETLFPMVATFPLTLKETVPNPFDYRQVRDYRGGSDITAVGAHL
jgi:hypothetical protein